jgi:hypothetical protein
MKIATELKELAGMAKSDPEDFQRLLPDRLGLSPDFSLPFSDNRAASKALEPFGMISHWRCSAPGDGTAWVARTTDLPYRGDELEALLALFAAASL